MSAGWNGCRPCPPSWTPRQEHAHRQRCYRAASTARAHRERHQATIGSGHRQRATNWLTIGIGEVGSCSRQRRSAAAGCSTSSLRSLAPSRGAAHEQCSRSASGRSGRFGTWCRETLCLTPRCAMARHTRFRACLTDLVRPSKAFPVHDPFFLARAPRFAFLLLALQPRAGPPERRHELATISGQPLRSYFARVQ